MGKRIIIMAGGTGGHVFPALAVAHCLRDRGWQVSWMGTRQGMESRVVPENDFDIDWLDVAGLRGKGLWPKITAPFMLLRACWQARKFLRRRKPDVVLGMGGFAAGPGGLMAWLQGIPLLIHEQNRVPGTTNRLLAGKARIVMEAFPGSFEKKFNAKFVGNPLRKEFIQATEKRSEMQDKKQTHILVVGGSLGAQALNEVVPEAMSLIPECKVMHQTGKQMQEAVRLHYEKLGIDANVLAFIDDIAEAYRWADVVVCRAGAMTVSELAVSGLPAVLVPFPFAIDNHQTANADYLVSAQAGVLLDQKQLTAAQLAEKLGYILSNRAAMATAAKTRAKPEATETVADYCAQEASV